VLYLIDRRNRRAFDSQIEAMHRIRHQLYVDGRGWRALARPDGREVDQFDTDAATYLLSLDGDGEVLGGIRLLPTTGPHLMRDVFSHIVTWGRVPSDDRIYEMTRLFLWRSAGGETRPKNAGEILCATLEFALLRRLSHISVVCDTFFLPRLLENGWKVHHLGLPTQYEEGSCIAILLEVSAEQLQRSRSRRGITGPSLTFSLYPPPHAARIDHAIAA
jgi:acyl-homoserine lactone synthase